MAYTPYVSPQVIKSRLRSLVNFGSGGNNSFQADSGGIVLTDEELNQYQEQGEQTAMSYLSTLYFVPLTNKNTLGTTLADFSDLTRGNLSSLFIASTCLKIVQYTFILEGARRELEIEGYQKQMQQVIDFVMGKDQAYGIIIPALEDLKLSDHYLTRQQNPIPQVIAADTKYTPILDRISRIGNPECIVYKR